ncbi:MAG: hypothetical protein Q8N98_05595 [bacterium]|nr:hypothetical protein [bacterium]
MTPESLRGPDMGVVDLNESFLALPPQEAFLAAKVTGKLAKEAPLWAKGGLVHDALLGPGVNVRDLARLVEQLRDRSDPIAISIARLDGAVAETCPDVDVMTSFSPEVVSSWCEENGLTSGAFPGGERTVGIVSPGSCSKVQLVDCRWEYRLPGREQMTFRLQVVTERDDDLRHPPCLKIDAAGARIDPTTLIGTVDRPGIGGLEIDGFEELICGGDVGRALYIVCRGARAMATRNRLSELVDEGSLWRRYAEFLFPLFSSVSAGDVIGSVGQGLLNTCRREWQAAILACAYFFKDSPNKRLFDFYYDTNRDIALTMLMGHLLKDILFFRFMLNIHHLVSPIEAVTANEDPFSLLERLSNEG